MHRGNPAAPIHLTEFADYQCPDCGVSYPVVEKVLQHYGPDKIYYTLHVFPLWLHRQAFILAEAAGVVALNAPEHYWEAAQFLFANQAQFFNSAYRNKTANDLYAHLAGWMPKFGVSPATFYTQIDSDAVFAHVDADIHQALIHQIYGTPTFVINGFKAENLDQTTTFAQWITYLDALLQPATLSA
ncbi:uncharacterized protein ACA1_255150 [Acanthamoeba castellanii str. Neff]|uniref:Thioredoxin-like fold domain-containing protein n=1 Tax=Acanthamoeba castellanii (strain ATCC 30010 / Neff) TaxID=1257118 RepID=L8HAY2_ACACF|nr:uncharacterized protein ACA1_255150 [Acanthamoeba castellanii str. Neff]ELR22417.1 hypothetical protein ACA1_255150 [Acanthamoeba castellanii str. Neff]